MMSLALEQWRASGGTLICEGRRLFVKEAGSGPTLLLIHGYPTSSFDWRAIWDRLALNYRVVAPDLLGMGFSDKPGFGGYSLLDHADRLESLIAALGVSRLHLVAHDMGVSIAQEMLARRRVMRNLPRIESVSFLNGGLFPQVYRPRALQRLLSGPVGACVGPHVPEQFFQRTLARLFSRYNPAPPALLDDWWQLHVLNGGRHQTHRVGRFFVERLAYRDRLVLPLLEGRTPMRMINGAQDPNSGRHMAEHWRSLDPAADIVSMPHAGHWPQIEDPEGTVQALLEFLEGGAERPVTLR